MKKTNSIKNLEKIFIVDSINKFFLKNYNIIPQIKNLELKIVCNEILHDVNNNTTNKIKIFLSLFLLNGNVPLLLNKQLDLKVQKTNDKENFILKLLFTNKKNFLTFIISLFLEENIKSTSSLKIFSQQKTEKFLKLSFKVDIFQDLFYILTSSFFSIEHKKIDFFLTFTFKNKSSFLKQKKNNNFLSFFCFFGNN